ncbi:hypothetical protein KL949_001885 [Ogataea haglerorum]|nr:hypothetical protein KL913_001527 [Ogataea haglerorum]KAG7721013.1 hypothetical protein KL949_001885 [Ogataea haglerorum]
MALQYLQSLEENIVSPPSSSTPVYKDDCMFSFETPLDKNGLDICMHCFQAFSRDGLHYTHQHAQFFSHSLYLNYRKIPRKQAERNSEQPLKMVKLEIKEQTEDELFETKTQIYCAEIDQTVDYPSEGIPSQIATCAAAILKATSSGKKQEIKAWEQEIVPCQHAFDIEQKPLAELDTSQCAQCGLKENLWICVTCGSIGCGRAQFGGVAGNSHALKHHESFPDHHIAVKLGSLSLNSADSYCYTCNDEVKVPDLVRLLATFGIDISQTIKTEKTLTELQIEQNMKWDFNMSDESGEVLAPVFGKGLTGIKNLGNSCYLSSVLQVLFSVRNFSSAFHIEEGMPVEKILNPGDPSTDLETQLFKLGDGLLSGRYSVPDELTTEKVRFQRGIKPQGFKSLIGEGHPEFCTMQQQDAFEFLLYLLDKIETQKLNGVSATGPTQAFDFVSENKIKCQGCGGVRLAKELTNNIRLPVQDKVLHVGDDGKKVYSEVRLEDCLSELTTSETIEYQCPKCQRLQPASKKQGFTSFPEYLIVSPQRIKLENWVPIKLDVPIKFEEKIDLSKFKSSDLQADEELLPEDDASSSFSFNQDAMNALLAMGFSENRCKRALYTTGNSDAETAMNWLFQHMEDPDIDDPFEPATASAPKVSEQELESLMSMGFNAKLATKALVLNKGSIEQAVEWLFANPDDDGEISQEGAGSPQKRIEELESNAARSAKYTLKGVICHKGVTIHSGHYVAFLKKQIEGEEKWVLFNDEKVVIPNEKSIKEIEKSGYIYVFEKLGL